jgi:hypothetical protein
MAFVKEHSIAAYATRTFLMEELSYQSIAATLTTSSGNFAVSAGYYGFNLYNEKKAGIAYGRKLSEKIGIGIQLDYFGTSISEYGNASALTFEAGIYYRISTRLSAGAYLFNPARLSSGIEDEPLPTIFSAGLAYEPGSKILLTAEAYKDINQPAQFRGGAEYRLIEQLFIRAGFQSNPSQFTFGTALHIGALQIDLASAVHSVLGVSPHAGLTYSLGGEKKDE